MSRITLSKVALVTGAAGFIGYHTSLSLLKSGYFVIGIDNLSDYYDVNLKRDRLNILKEDANFLPIIGNIQDPCFLRNVFSDHKPHIVVHLAAQAGVRYSIDNPRSYLDTNICGTFEILEAVREFPPEHVLLASTSSVYGANAKMPYAELDRTDHQMSFYAATKKATEVISHSYSHLFNIPITVFRFFTVYGPWGRPDMALFKFTQAILNGSAIDVYNHGDMKRDFTYIDDLVRGVSSLIDNKPSYECTSNSDSLSPVAPWRVVNIGNSRPVALMDFIKAIELATGKEAITSFKPMQPGDVPATWADASLLSELTGYSGTTDVYSGVEKFVDWYRNYYSV